MRWNKMSISEFPFSAKLDDKEAKQIVACKFFQAGQA